MKTLSDTLKRQLERGNPLAPFAVAKLRKAGNEAVLKANAGNIVKAMLTGGAVTAEQLEEAQRYYPEQAAEWLEAGGRVAQGKGERWMSLNAIAAEMGVTQPALYQMITRHPDEAPSKRADGKWEYGQVRDFYATRTRRQNAPLKEQILEQELRLKRVKADAAEGLLIERATVVDILTEADVQLEAALTAMAKKYAGAQYERAIEDAKTGFKRWREFLAELSGGSGGPGGNAAPKRAKGRAKRRA